MEYFKELSKNIVEFVKTMSPSQMVMLLGVTAGLLVGIFVVVGWINSEVNYSELYSELEPAEAGEIIAYLNETGVSYKLSDGGRTIKVPANKVYSSRITLASQGLPQSGHIGYSIFDQSNLGMTEFLQNLNFRRALEGELMNTIKQLSSVQAVRVHIVMPKNRLFKEDKKEATASVVLKLKKANMLTKSQMAGITHLVASSVEGLKPENISIIDYNGNLLSSEASSDMLARLSTTQLEVRKNAENYLENKAQSLLDGVIGPNKSIVRVSVELNFKQVERTSELYDPNSPVVRSEEKISETMSTSDKQEEAAEIQDNKKSETSVTNYEINKTVEHIVNSVGNIERLSVAVMLDGVYKVITNADGIEEKVYEPRSQDEINQITAIVKSAVGFNSVRNDQIEVVNLTFENQGIGFEQDRLDKMVEQEFYYNIGKNVGFIIIGLVVLLYVRRKLKKLFASLKRLLPGAELSEESKDTIDQLQTDEEGETEEEKPLPPIIKKKQRPTMVNQMQQLASEKPDEVAKVIKTMMFSEDE